MPEELVIGDLNLKRLALPLLVGFEFVGGDECEGFVGGFRGEDVAEGDVLK
jgi:hypothetical protein